MALYRTVQLLIDRGGGVTIPRDAFEFELPILTAMHGSMGSGLVREIGEGSLDIPDDDADAVFATMQSKYAGKVGEAALVEAYQNVKQFAKALKEARVDAEDAEEEEEPVKAKEPAKATKAKATKASADNDPKD